MTGPIDPATAPVGERVDPPDSSRGLAGRSIAGAAWALSGQFLGEPVRIASTMVLARVLTPADFGLIGMAAAFLGLTAISNEMGLPASIIQRREVTREEVSSAFWVNALAGTVLTAVLVAASPAVAWLYGEVAVAPVFAVMSLSVLLNALAQVPNALLRRRLDFKAPAAANVAAVTFQAGVSIAAALAGMGVWSLVAGQLVAVSASGVVVAVAARFRPMFRLKWSDVRPYLAFGGGVSAGETANYMSYNMDNMLVGRLLGPASLGIYALAYNLITYPARTVATLTASVAMPAFSRVSGERERFRSGYLRSLRMSSLVTMPLLAAAIVVGPELIVGLYGDGWEAAIVPFQVLCFAGMSRAVTAFGRTALKASGRAGTQLVWDLALLLGVIVSVTAGARWGVGGVAAGVAAVTVAASAGVQASVDRLLDLRHLAPLRALSGPVVLSFAVAASSAAVRAAGLAAGLPAILVALAGLALPMTAAWTACRKLDAFSEIAQLEEALVSAISRRRAMVRGAASAE